MKDIKCVVWDMDHTLWDGILSESDDLQLKPDIHKILKELDDRGILLSISSKNNREDVEKILKQFALWNYFLYPQINWEPKSVSIAAIQKKLNIGMDSIMFIDDQVFEREEVKLAHPEVEVIDAQMYLELLKMPRLRPRFITSESKHRRQMYLDDQNRELEEEKFSDTPNKFLMSLEMKFIISKAKEEDLMRAEELTARTNQLNSTGIQYNYEELKEFIYSNDHCLWVCELKDRFGSYGKIGIILVETKPEIWKIKLLLMSCRTISRGVGTIAIIFLIQKAKKMNVRLQAEFVRTDRNRQMLLAYQLANFVEKERDGNKILFENDLLFTQSYPSFVQVAVEEE